MLDYSLRRRVPDEDLGTLFGVDPSEVARMRATAVERLSNELGVQRGEDLGHMLKLLLDASTWDQLAGASPPSGADEPAAPLEPEPEVPEPDDGERPESGHPPVGAQGHEAPASPA